MRAILLAAVALSACSPPPAQAPATTKTTGVRVWQDTILISTWEDRLPDRNAPFDYFGQKRVNYPYALRRDFADHPERKEWRALHLENEFLHCIVLPDLGGHLYGCTDKRTNAEMFYANASIKMANVAYRGAWAALGIEFNFPVSHSWTTVSPVDFATSTASDGSASIWVGNVDRVYGMAWRVELVLKPGHALLEQRTTLENPSDARHRFYYWTNAAVRATDDTEIHYPMELTASHGFTEIDTWPVTSKGLDLHIVGNHKDGPVSLFSHASREPFMAVLDPRTRTGVAHYSSPTDLPAKKFYSWGVDGDARAWNRTLSDDNSNYVEVQAGLFRNQETYSFLEPLQSIAFTEHWIPLRDVTTISRVNPEAVLHLGREKTDVVLAVGVTHAIPNASITLRLGPHALKETRASLSPVATYTQRWSGLPASSKYTVEVKDANGALVIRHTEGAYDFTPRDTIKIGPQPPVDTKGDPLQEGTNKELDGRLLEALEIYERGLKAAPSNLGLMKAAGRLAYTLKRYTDAATLLEDATHRAPTDTEATYYLGLTYVAQGRVREAKIALEAAQHQSAPALVALAAIAGREGDRAQALALLERANAGGAITIALLRASGRIEEARRRLDVLLRRDPTNNGLRYEAVRLGANGGELWRHLAGDSERILALAAERMHYGLWADAIDLLARKYPKGEGVVGEVGMPSADVHPLIAYYRGVARDAIAEDPTPDFALGARMSTDLVFPNRADSIPVLERAIAANPNDATAHMLLGSLFLSGGLVDTATREWETVHRLDSKRRGLHRNLAFTILRAGGKVERALALFEEGTTVEPDNTEIWTGLDETLQKLGRGAEARLAALRRHPQASSLPSVLLLKAALLLSETGRFDEAEKSLAGRKFDREERGVDVRGVYMELRIARAEAFTRARDCKNARNVIDHLTDAVPNLSFTDSALSAYANAPAIKTRADAIKRACP